MHAATPANQHRHVTGLDLSLTATGIATVTLDSGHIHLHTHRTTGAKGAPLTDRIERMRHAVSGVLELVPVDAFIVIESPSFGSFSTSAHERAGMWWRVVAFLSVRGYPIAPVSPRTRAKYAAGHRPVAKPRSGPNKQEVLAAMRADHPTLTIPNDNVADGLALAAAGARHLGSPIDPTTRQRVEAMAAIKWPTSTTNQKGTRP